MQPRIPHPRTLLPGLLSVGGLLCLAHPGNAGAAEVSDRDGWGAGVAPFRSVTGLPTSICLLPVT